MLTTLALVKGELLSDKVTLKSGEDSKIMGYIRAVERRIFMVAGFGFAPYYEQRLFDAIPERISSVYNTYDMRQYIMLPTALMKGSTSYTWQTDVKGYPNYAPYKMLRWTANPTTTPSATWYPYCLDYTPYNVIESIKVTGYWGYRTDYNSAWLPSGDTILNDPSISDSATSITVSDVDGVDDLGRSPRFSPGNLIRFEDGVSDVYEIAEVTAVDTINETITVRRGQRGTEPTTHLLGTELTVWTAEPDIERITTRQAALLYTRKGSYQASQTPETTSNYPQDLLVELYNTIDAYKGEEVQH